MLSPLIWDAANPANTLKTKRSFVTTCVEKTQCNDVTLSR